MGFQEKERTTFVTPPDGEILFFGHFAFVRIVPQGGGTGKAFRTSFAGRGCYGILNVTGKISYRP